MGSETEQQTPDSPERRSLAALATGMDEASFAIENVLGSGTYAKVYLIHTKERAPLGVRRSYALKILCKANRCPKVLEYFETEIEIHRRLNHANVASLCARLTAQHRRCLC